MLNPDVVVGHTNVSDFYVQSSHLWFHTRGQRQKQLRIQEFTPKAVNLAVT